MTHLHQCFSLLCIEFAFGRRILLLLDFRFPLTFFLTVACVSQADNIFFTVSEPSFSDPALAALVTVYQTTSAILAPAAYLTANSADFQEGVPFSNFLSGGSTEW